MDHIYPYFIDIETVPENNGEGRATSLFQKKFEGQLRRDVGLAEGKITDSAWMEFHDKNAALYAEFGKIVAISVGAMSKGKFYVKSYVGSNEKEILGKFGEAIKLATSLCAHNGLEFDFPYLTRRHIINETPLPQLLNTGGKKKWDVEAELRDTMAMWRGLQYQHRASLDLLCHVLGIPSPKADMTGADVATVYFQAISQAKDELPFDFDERKAKDFIKIGTYCSGDVIACAQVYSRLKGLPQITKDQIYMI